MPVVWKGKGVSGMRSGSFEAPVPDSGSSQPVLRTETNGSVPSSIYLQAERFNNKVYAPTQATPDFMPTGATHSDPNATSSSTTDIADPNSNPGPWGPGVNAVNTPYAGPGSGR